MLNSEVLEKRKALAALLKNARETFGIRFTTIQKLTGMSTSTLYGLESGSIEWRVDTQITYINALNELIDKKQKTLPEGNKLPERPPILQLLYNSKIHHNTSTNDSRKV